MYSGLERNMKEKKLVLILIIVLILLVVIIIAEDVEAVNWTNATDGFSTRDAGAEGPVSITFNGSNLFVLDQVDDFVYIFDLQGNNLSGGFSTLEIGHDVCYGITTNGSDNGFWIVSLVNDSVYQFNNTGSKLSNFSTLPAGADKPTGITINGTGTDFWVVDYLDKFIYHFNSSGYNYSDGMDLSSFANVPLGIVNNKELSPGAISNFWMTDDQGNANYAWYLNSTGGNLSDSFNLSLFDIGSAAGITTNSSSSPWDLWIVDQGDDFVYHFYENLTENITEAPNGNGGAGGGGKRKVEEPENITEITIDKTEEFKEMILENWLIIVVIVLFFFILITPHTPIWVVMVLTEIVLVGLLLLPYLENVL